MTIQFMQDALSSAAPVGRPDAASGPLILPAVAVARSLRAQKRLARRAAAGQAGVRRIALPADPAARAHFVHRWIARHARRASQGLSSFVLVLPLGLASAAAQDVGPAREFVFADTLPGVTSARMNADGTVTLTLGEGRTQTVDAEDARLLPDGRIAVAVDSVDEVLALVGAVPVGSIWLGGLLAGVVAGAAVEGALPSPQQGIVVDGYIIGATVFRDLNGNGALDAGEPSTTTTTGGVFVLPFTADPASQTARLISFGGIDEVTGAAVTGTWSAPANATVISPLTSMVQALIERGSTPADAVTTVRDIFNLGAGVNPLTADPVALADAGSLEALKAAAQLQAAVANVVAIAQQTAGANLTVAQSLQISQAAKLALLEQMQTNPGALGDAASLTLVITQTVPDADAVAAADLGAALAALNTAVQNITPAGGTQGAINSAVRDIETLQTVAQKEMTALLAGPMAEGALTDLVNEAINNLANPGRPDDQPYRPILTTGRAAVDEDGAITLGGRGTAGSTVSVELRKDGVLLGSTTAVVGEDGTWQATLVFEGPPPAIGLYDVRLQASLAGMPDSAARSNPLVIGDEVTDFSTFTVMPGNDFFFYKTDLVGSTTQEVADSTVTLWLADGADRFVYSYIESDQNFGAGRVALPEGTLVLLDGSAWRSLDQIEVRVINYAWTDLAFPAVTQNSVVINIFDVEGGLDYIGQLGGDKVPQFATRAEAEAWINGANPTLVPNTSDVGPGAEITLASIRAFLADISRDETPMATLMGQALAGSEVQVQVAGLDLTATATAAGLWSVSTPTVEGASPFTEGQAYALRVTDPAGQVDLYRSGASGQADSLAVEAGLRNVLLGFEQGADTVDVSALGLSQAALEALLATAQTADLAVLGQEAAPSAIIGASTVQPIILVGITVDSLTIDDFAGLLGGNT